MDSDISTESQDTYKNVFCNPVFEPEVDFEETKRNFRIDIHHEPTKLRGTASQPVVSVFVVGLKEQFGGRGMVIVSTGVSVIISVLCIILLFLKQMKTNIDGMSTLDSNFGERIPQNFSLNNVSHSSVSPLPEKELTFFTECGGMLMDFEGTFSSPNHPGPYPPNSYCLWEIRVSSPFLVQIHVSALAIEGPSPCLFDWLEVKEEIEKMPVVTRYCGNVAPPTVNTNSSIVWVSFRSDGSIGGNGFVAQYHSVLPEQKGCSREEFMCDSGRCLLPISICDNHPNCQDHSDEVNCSQKHKVCGGKMTGEYGSLSSPNHPKPYPHQQTSCCWLGS